MPIFHVFTLLTNFKSSMHDHFGNIVQLGDVLLAAIIIIVVNFEF